MNKLDITQKGHPLIVDIEALLDLLCNEFEEMRDSPFSETKVFIGKSREGIEFQLVLTREEDEFLEDGVPVITFPE